MPRLDSPDKRPGVAFLRAAREIDADLVGIVMTDDAANDVHFWHDQIGQDQVKSLFLYFPECGCGRDQTGGSLPLALQEKMELI